MIISGAYQILDGFFIGKEGLAGVGTGSLYSIAKGAEKEEEALQIIGQIGFLIIVPGIILGTLLYFIAPYLVDIGVCNIFHCYFY